MSLPVRPLTTLRRTVLAGLALVALSACATDRLAGPSLRDASAQGKLATTTPVVDTTVTKASIISTALLRTTPLSEPVTRSVRVTKALGGEILLPGAGLEVKIPAGAIAGDTLTITVTALAGRAVAYEFAPHGTQFLASVKFVQDLARTTWDGGKSGKTLLGGYFRSATQLDPLTGAALLDERLPIKLNAGKLGMDLWHFSGYMVSMD